jgi:hypothetical protein
VVFPVWVFGRAILAASVEAVIEAVGLTELTHGEIL